MNGVVVLQEIYYIMGMKHSYRRHHYIPQNVLLLKAVQVNIYPMEYFSSYMGDPAPTESGQTATACEADIY
jgi:hypothetical protein